MLCRKERQRPAQHLWWCNNRRWHNAMRGSLLLLLTHFWFYTAVPSHRKYGWSQRGWSEWEIDQKAIDLVRGRYWSLYPLPSLWISAALIDYWCLRSTNRDNGISAITVPQIFKTLKYMWFYSIFIVIKHVLYLTYICFHQFLKKILSESKKKSTG